MDTILFFEKLATNPHHQIQLEDLINLLPAQIRNAYLQNDIESFKQELSGSSYLANESHIAKIEADFHR